MDLKKKPYIKLDLQKFAESDEDEKDKGTETDVPKYTDKEVDELFNKKFAKVKKQFEDEFEQKLQDFQAQKAEAEKLQAMNTEEKIAFQTEQLKKKAEELEAQNAKLQKQIDFNEMSKEASRMLIEKKLVPTEELLKLLVRGTAEETLQAVTLYVSSVGDHVKEQVKDALTGTPPTASVSKSTVVNPFSKDTFNLTKQAELLKTNPELYKQLKSQAK